MKKSLLLSLGICVSLLVAASALADDSAALQGKWLTKKTNDEGVTFSQTIEVKKDKFTFQVLDSSGELRLHAQGSLKLEKLGPYNNARFFDIRGGESASNLEEVNDEFNTIYVLGSDTWTLASNFDKERDQKPSADIYQRIKQTVQTGSLVIDAVEMADVPQADTWFFCFEVTSGDSKARHYHQNKGYDKKQLTIPVGLKLQNVHAGQKCSFWMQLDDVDDDACGDEPDNRSTGDFTITEQGSQTFKPEANWTYTIRWHLAK